MKRILIITLFSITLTGIFYWWKVNNPTPLSAWDLVPTDALAVYEQNKNSNATADLLLEPFLSDSLRQIIYTTKDLLISYHVLGKEEVGVVLYLPVTMKDHPAFNIKTGKQRAFEGLDITEIPLTGKKVLSTVTVDNTFVVSTTPLLIEDVIRQARQEEKNGFHAENQPLYKFPRMESDGGRTYFSLTQFPQLVNLFLKGEQRFPALGLLGKSAVLEIKKQKQGLLFNGYALDSIAGKNSLLSIFNHQRPVSMTLQSVVSQRTGLLLYYGISDFDSWTKDRSLFCRTLRPGADDSIAALESRYKFNARLFYQGLGDEVGLCRSGIFNDDVLIVEVNNPKQVSAELEKLQRHHITDSLGSETYSQYQINTLEIDHLPATLFYPLAEQKMNYYFVAGHYLVLAHDPEDIKAMIDDWDAENVWSKSSEWNEFLSNSQEANLAVIFDARNARPSVESEVNNLGQALVDAPAANRLNKGSFQFGRLEKNYYLNGVMLLDPGVNAKQKENFTEVTLAANVKTPIEIVRNHTNGTSELLFADDENRLTLLSPKLKTLFTTPLDGKIVSGVAQIDFYKNKKLQYVFATEKSIYLIDRLGNPVKGFPLKISRKAPIHFFEVIDYENTKDYQFLITDIQGNIELISPDGQAEKSFKPVQIEKDLLVSPRFIRSKGKDFLISLSEAGVLYAHGKNGVPVAGFPLDLKFRPVGNWIIEKNGNDRIAMISDEGLMIQVDLSGTVTNRSNLIKSSPTSRFLLVLAANKQDGVISRIDKDKIAVLSITGETLVEKENPGSGDLYLSYYETPYSRKIFAFTDPQQEFSYFYDSKGSLVFPRPLENQQPPALIAEKQGGVTFYTVNSKQIRSYKRGHVN